MGHRLADVEKCGKVHHGSDVVLAQGAAQRLDVSDLTLHELPEFDRGPMSRDEAVVDDRAVAGPLERFCRVTADVAGAPGHEDGARISGQWRST